MFLDTAMRVTLWSP